MAEGPKKLSKEAWRQMVTLLIGGFSFVAALAWNDAVQSLFREFIDTEKASVLMKFVYAAMITLIVVSVSLRLSRFVSQDDNQTPS